MTISATQKTPAQQRAEALEQEMIGFFGERAIVQLIGSWLVNDAMLFRVEHAAKIYKDAYGDPTWLNAVTTAKTSASFLLKHHEIVDRTRRLNERVANGDRLICDEIRLKYSVSSRDVPTPPEGFWYVASNQQRSACFFTRVIEQSQFWVLENHRTYSFTIRPPSAQAGQELRTHSIIDPTVLIDDQPTAAEAVFLPGSLVVIQHGKHVIKSLDPDRFPEKAAPRSRASSSAALPPPPLTRHLEESTPPPIPVSTLSSSNSSAGSLNQSSGRASPVAAPQPAMLGRSAELNERAAHMDHPQAVSPVAGSLGATLHSSAASSIANSAAAAAPSAGGGAKS